MTSHPENTSQNGDDIRGGLGHKILVRPCGYIIRKFAHHRIFSAHKPESTRRNIILPQMTENALHVSKFFTAYKATCTLLLKKLKKEEN